MAVKNKDIVYVLRMRNETRAALRAYQGDLKGAATATAAATAQAKAMASSARSLSTAMRSTGASAASVASNMATATSSIRNANRELARFTSAANASAKVGQNMGNAASSISATTTALRSLNSSLASFAKAAERTGLLAQRLNAGATAVNGATVALRNATTQASAFARASQNAGNALQNINNRARGGGAGGTNGPFANLLASAGQARNAVLAVGAAVATVMAVKGVFELTDSFTALQSQLKLVTTGTDNLNATYEKLFGLAQNTRQSLESTVNLYSRVSRATKSMNLSQAQTLVLTDAINKAVAIFGGPAASAEAALFQLSQGFASGALRGEELNSVLEQSPRLAQAIADGMGVAVGSLKTLGEQGKLTSEAVLKAIMSQRDKLDKEFAKVGITVGQAFTVSKNALLDYVGSVDKATKTSSTFAASIIAASAGFRDPALVKAGVAAMTAFGMALNGIVQAAVLVSKALIPLTAALAGLATYMAAPALMSFGGILLGAARGFFVLTGAANVFNLALLATVARTRVLQVLLSRTGVGLAVLAIGTAVGYWYSRTTDTETATTELASAVDKVKLAYDEAGGSIDNVADKIKGLTVTQTRANLELAKANLEAARKVPLQSVRDVGVVSAYKDLTFGAGGDQAKQLTTLSSEFAAGKRTVDEYRTAVDNIGKNAANGGVAALAKSMLDASQGAKTAEDQFKQFEALLKILEKTATAADGAVLGLAKSAMSIDMSILTSNYSTAIRVLQEMSPAGKKLQDRADGIIAASQAQAKAQEALNQLYKAGGIGVQDYLSETKLLKKYLQDAKDDTYGLVDALKALKTYQDEGRDGSTYDPKLKALAAEKQAYLDIIKTLKDANASQEKLDAATAAYQTRVGNIQGQARFDLGKDLEDQLKDMENENRLIGLNGAARQRLTAIMQVEKAARDANLDIDSVRQYVSSFTQEYDKLLKVQQEGQFAMGMGEKIKDLKAQVEVMGVAEDKQDKLNKLIEFENAAREAGLTNVDRWRQQYVAALDAVKAAQDAVNKNFALGFGEGLRSFGEQATNLRAQAKDLASGMGEDISSSLKTALKGGGFNIRELLGNIAGRFVDIGVDNVVGSISKSLGGMFGDGTKGNPAQMAQDIAKKQNDAYLMTIAGVQGAGTNFIAGLRTSFQTVVDGVAAIRGTPAANGAPSTTGNIALGRAADRNSVAGYASSVKSLKTDIIQEVLNANNGSAAGKAMATGANFNGQVDNRLITILQTAAKRSNLDVTAISGYRPGDPRQHGRGLATDVQLSDPITGKQYNNYQNGKDFGTYEKFAQQAKIAQMQQFPELNDQFRWGGYFGGGKGKYGAMDSMHFDLGGSKRLGMAGGSWGQGLNDNQRSLFPDANSIGMNVQQLQQQLSQVGTAAQTAAQATQQVNTAYAATGTNTTTAAQSVTTLAQNAQQAATTMQGAATSMQGAGQAAQTAGTAAVGADKGLGSMAQGLSGLLGPLNQVVPGLGSFAQSILGLLGNIGSTTGGAAGAGGAGGGFLSSIFGLFFANGGVMSSRGKMPLKTYSKGGVAKKPQIAMFGEGGRNEAYVPLPDGKSIPVSMSGGSGGGVNMGDINIDVKMSGSSGDPEKDKKHADDVVGKVDKMLDQKIAAWAMRESRNGGMLNKMK